MRRVFKGFAVAAVVVCLAVPAAARTREETGSPQPKQSPTIIQLLKQFVVRSFGDGLTCPRP